MSRAIKRAFLCALSIALFGCAAEETALRTLFMETYAEFKRAVLEEDDRALRLLSDSERFDAEEGFRAALFNAETPLSALYTEGENEIVEIISFLPDRIPYTANVYVRSRAFSARYALMFLYNGQTKRFALFDVYAAK